MSLVRSANRLATGQLRPNCPRIGPEGRPRECVECWRCQIADSRSAAPICCLAGSHAAERLQTAVSRWADVAVCKAARGAIPPMHHQRKLVMDAEAATIVSQSARVPTPALALSRVTTLATSACAFRMPAISGFASTTRAPAGDESGSDGEQPSDGFLISHAVLPVEYGRRQRNGRLSAWNA